MARKKATKIITKPPAPVPTAKPSVNIELQKKNDDFLRKEIEAKKALEAQDRAQQEQIQRKLKEEEERKKRKRRTRAKTIRIRVEIKRGRRNSFEG